MDKYVSMAQKVTGRTKNNYLLMLCGVTVTASAAPTN